VSQEIGEPKLMQGAKMSTRFPECAYPTSVTRDHVQKRRKELAFFGRMLHKRHYVSGCDGNLSVRLEGGHVLTTPTGISKGFLRPEHMVIVDLDGRKLDGVLQPSSEIQMHLTIYKQRPDIEAVVHAHPCIATGLGCAGMNISEPICSELVLTLGTIPLAPYAMPGSPALSDALLPFVANHEAILMQNHGVVSYGSTLAQAYLNMETVEHTARIMLVTNLLGSPRKLNSEQVAALLDLKLRKRVSA
jgi:L-fuculose-phosphate aldolase